MFLLSNTTESRGASGASSPTVQLATYSGNDKQQKLASLIIEPLYISPVSGGGALPVISQGSMVQLGFSVKNVGIGKLQPGETYSLTCKVLSGSNSCPLAFSTGPIPELEPGASNPYSFIGVTGAKAGIYRLIVANSLNSGGNDTHVDFRVPRPKLSSTYIKLNN